MGLKEMTEEEKISLYMSQECQNLESMKAKCKHNPLSQNRQLKWFILLQPATWPAESPSRNVCQRFCRKTITQLFTYLITTLYGDQPQLPWFC